MDSRLRGKDGGISAHDDSMTAYGRLPRERGDPLEAY